MLRFVRRVRAEYRWLQFVEKHTHDLTEREQCEILTEIGTIGMPFSEKLKLFHTLTFSSKMFLVFVMLPLTAFFNLYDTLRR